MRNGLIIKGVLYGLFLSFIALSIHADYLGKDRYLLWVDQSWIDTKVWHWVLAMVAGTYIWWNIDITID